MRPRPSARAESIRFFAAFAALAALLLALPAGAPADEGGPALPDLNPPADRFLSLAELVPPRTLLLVEAPDVGKAADAIAGTDVGKAAHLFEPFWAELWGGLRAGLAEPLAEMERETGLTLDAILDVAGGGWGFALVSLPEEHAHRGFERMPGAAVRVRAMEERPAPAFAIGFGGGASRRAAIEKALEAIRRTAPPPREGEGEGEVRKYERLKIPVEVLGRGPAMHAFWIGDNLYLASTKGLAGDMIGAAYGMAPAPPLAREASFQAVKAKVARGGAPLLFVYANPRDGLAGLPDGPERKQLEDMGILDLGPSGFGLGAAGGRLELAASFGVKAGSAKGPFAALTSSNPVDVLAAARLAPPSATSFYVADQDLATGLDVLFEMDPRQDVFGFGRALAELEQSLGGVKIREDILASLGSSFVSVSFVPEAGAIPESVMTFPVRDRGKLEAALAKGRAAGGLGEVAGPGGSRIVYARAPLGRLGDTRFDERAVVAAVVRAFFPCAGAFDGDRFVLSSSPQAIAEYLEWRQKGGGPTLADNAAFRAELAATPGGPTGEGLAFFAFEDPRLVPAGYDLATRFLRFLEPLARTVGLRVDTALLPRARALAGELSPGSTYAIAEGDAQTMVMRTSARTAGFGVGLVGATAFLSGLLFVSYDASEAPPMPPWVGGEARAAPVAPPEAVPAEPLPPGAETEPWPVPPVEPPKDDRP